MNVFIWKKSIAKNYVGVENCAVSMVGFRKDSRSIRNREDQEMLE